MTLGKLSLVLVGAALLSPFAARAGDDDHRRHAGWEKRERRVEVHVHAPGCGHHGPPAPPPGRASAAGRYELQPVQRWVPGYHEKVWVPEVCQEKRRPHRRKLVCEGGYYQERWVEGRHETVQEWVWVPRWDGGHRHDARPRIHVSATF